MVFSDSGSIDGGEGAMESNLDVKIGGLDKVSKFDDVQFESKSSIDSSMSSIDSSIASCSSGCCMGGGVIGVSILVY